MRPVVTAFVLLILLGFDSAGAQQNSPGQPPAPVQTAGIPGDISAYGPNDFSIITLNDVAFRPYSNTTAYQWSDGIYLPSGGLLVAPAPMPTGVRVEAWELEACDTSVGGSVIVQLFECARAPGANCVQLDSIATGGVEAPGCATFFRPLPVPFTVQDARYMVQFAVGEASPNNRLRAVRIAYKRQVSPAPATASFGDVPVGTALHQYVEALVAAGITAGCGEGNYCPNAPVTRGQMAVFLAKALGLHWAP